MPFQPQVNQELTIDNVTCWIAEHPAAPGIPYGQEGRQAVVFQLAAGANRRALKVFKPRYRLPEMVSLAERIAPLIRSYSISQMTYSRARAISMSLLYLWSSARSQRIN